ncbi:MAG: LapA family protein [Candidatus Methanosuratincola sp.]
MNTNLKLVIAVLVAAIIVVFTLQNAVEVKLRFLFWTLAMPQALLFFIMFFGGVLLGWILRSIHEYKKEY